MLIQTATRKLFCDKAFAAPVFSRTAAQPGRRFAVSASNAKSKK
jgi:hypothetical protein